MQNVLDAPEGVRAVTVGIVVSADSHIPKCVRHARDLLEDETRVQNAKDKAWTLRTWKFMRSLRKNGQDEVPITCQGALGEEEAKRCRVQKELVRRSISNRVEGAFTYGGEMDDNAVHE